MYYPRVIEVTDARATDVTPPDRMDEVTGILFGVLPARQAARLDPVQSLAKR